MRLVFSKKQLALLVYTVIISASNMLMKPFMEGMRSFANFSEDNVFFNDANKIRIVLLNYMLILHYIAMFVILTVLIVYIVRLFIKSEAFLSLYREGKHGEINDLDSETEFEKRMLVVKFEPANDLIWTIDSLEIDALIILVSALFCS
ncbi:MAG: hypothetical protein NC203_04880, partial [Firmicutes bacterium]|nr:hypothetical protein [Bacillota bacterium]